MQAKLTLRCLFTTQLQTLRRVARRVNLFHTFPASKFLSTMPPKLKATSSKRKLESNSDESNGEEGSTSQKALPSKKPRNEKSTTLESSQPTNKTLPDSIVIPPKEPGTTRIVAWNVSGYAASTKKVNITLSSTCILLNYTQGFSRYVEAENADILIITETKVSRVIPLPIVKRRLAFSASR